MTASIKQYLDECSRHYYNGAPIISDEIFDRLAQSVGYAKVGAKQHEDEEKHYFPMYSLKKFYEDEDIKNPLELYTGEKVHSLKLDGAALSHLYIDGKLVRSLTRGDGITGKVVTNKFLETNLIPKEINHIGILQVTGEICAPKLIENARNYAAGSLNLKSIDEFKTRAVEFFAYGTQPFLTSTYSSDMNMLKRFGFNIVLGEYELDNIYPCDGLVYRIDDNKIFEEWGYTNEFPRGAYARKERPLGQVTKLLDVVWQVGKTGRVSPVAILDPVMLGDAMVSRATLNNPGFIEMLDLQIGDMVHVIRSGEIIPCITHKVEG